MFLGVPGARWEAVPVEDALELYDMAEASNDPDWDVEDLFDEEECEDFFVHRGDLRVDGALALGNGPDEDKDTVYVIDGALTVDGPVTFLNMDVYTTLYVTGSVVAHDLVCLWDCSLFVGRSLTVRNLLATSLIEMGSLVVRGPVSAGTWLEMGGRGRIHFSGAPSVARVAARADVGSDGYSEGSNAVEHLGGAAGLAEVVLPEFFEEDGTCDDFELSKAVFEGRPVLR
ncbi:hypothetical protein R8Z50_18565 [Longispora sp. K20-0274]|uniref:hypothetical protein n=1 Tax=Longispora sp. K20-0274 TaxID=3088255 RepID=UPI003999F056